jgi:wyosine [tRNA(Phe)-imidazoG37] synthetase (radical SAM superfamily)
MYKYLFGPVLSRRLGLSLGVDLVTKKTCSLDCIYCEVGRTVKSTTKRQEYSSHGKIIQELNYYLLNNPIPNYITLTGSGEPTLNSKIGAIIRYIKQNHSNVPVAVITNGTLLSEPQVQTDIEQADVVLPSLDAVTTESFNKINKPSSHLNIRNYISGLIDFRKVYKGQLWLEVMIIPSINDHKEELLELKKVITKINPDYIQLNTLDRPGVLNGLKPASIKELEFIISFWGFNNAQIIASSSNSVKTKREVHITENGILNLISRRPCTIQDIAKSFNTKDEVIIKYINSLKTKKIIKSYSQKRGAFYKIND